MEIERFFVSKFVSKYLEELRYDSENGTYHDDFLGVMYRKNDAGELVEVID